MVHLIRKQTKKQSKTKKKIRETRRILFLNSLNLRYVNHSLVKRFFPDCLVMMKNGGEWYNLNVDIPHLIKAFEKYFSLITVAATVVTGIK